MSCMATGNIMLLGMGIITGKQLGVYILEIHERENGYIDFMGEIWIVNDIAAILNLEGFFGQ